MDRRKERRLNLELPVRVFGLDKMARPFAEIVRLGNVSNTGAVLNGVRARMQTGEIVDVQLGTSRAQFRILWTNFSGEVGLQALASSQPALSMGIGLGLSDMFEMVGTG